MKSTGRGSRTIGCAEFGTLLPLWLEGAGYRSEEIGDRLRIYGDVRGIGSFFGRLFMGLTLVGGEMRYGAGDGFVDIQVEEDGDGEGV